MTAVVTLENVSVRYLSAAEPAISDVSLCVEPGELLLLAGPSGCGKSTVMRVVNGLVPNAYRADIGGSVTVGGQDAKELTTQQISETVGTLLQNPGRQVVGHSVLADIAFGLENRGVRAGDILARVHRVARRLGIDESLLSAGTNELSGGQLQLVAFAGVLVMRPRVIIVDEPLANLDPDAATRLLRSVREYVDADGAAVMIEHRIDELVSISIDRVLSLEHGRTVYSGDVSGFLRTADGLFLTVAVAATAASLSGHAPGLWVW